MPSRISHNTRLGLLPFTLTWSVLAILSQCSCLSYCTCVSCRSPPPVLSLCLCQAILTSPFLPSLCLSQMTHNGSLSSGLAQLSNTTGGTPCLVALPPPSMGRAQPLPPPRGGVIQKGLCHQWMYFGAEAHLVTDVSIRHGHSAHVLVAFAS